MITTNENGTPVPLLSLTPVNSTLNTATDLSAPLQSPNFLYNNNIHKSVEIQNAALFGITQFNLTDNKHINKADERNNLKPMLLKNEIILNHFYEDAINKKIVATGSTSSLGSSLSSFSIPEKNDAAMNSLFSTKFLAIKIYIDDSASESIISPPIEIKNKQWGTNLTKKNKVEKKINHIINSNNKNNNNMYFEF